MTVKNGFSNGKEENLSTGLFSNSFCVRLIRFLKKDEKEPPGSLG